MKKIILFFVFSLLLCITSPANAFLLGIIDFTESGSTDQMKVSDLDAYGFFFGYDPILSDVPPNPLATDIGIIEPISNIITSYDFNTSNSPMFSAVTSRFTASATDILYRMNMFYDYDDPIFGVKFYGSGGGTSVRVIRGTPIDWEIDFIRLNVENFYVGSWESGPLGYGVDYSVTANWQIWGTIIPSSETVPEPATMLLLGFGLAGAWKLRRRVSA